MLNHPRLNRARNASAPEGELIAATEIILGIDPGTRRTGFGVIESGARGLKHLEYGVIALKETASLPARLMTLRRELQLIFDRRAVTRVAVEKIFFGKNADSAFKLGHARGICLSVAAENGAEVDEFAATYVKKCVVGSGGASKDHVRMVVFNLFRINDPGVALDASDALALAVASVRGLEERELLRRAARDNPR